MTGNEKPYERARNPSRVWYGERRIDRWFNGVFEGGAAKGVAYPGALEAMAANRAWFSSVAGTSAGAITAAFIAAGAQAGYAKDFTVEMFELVDTGLLSGIRRLFKRGGFYPATELLHWLDEQYARLLVATGGEAVKRPVDFQTMFEISGIELFVVATDLSLHRQIVFSHIFSPRCSVAEAVLASASTPLLFESRLLEVPSEDDPERMLHHTIVDGGFWSNFPLFVYRDPAFRRVHGAKPEQVDDAKIVGFLLGGKDKDDIDGGADIAFLDDPRQIDAYEWSVERDDDRSGLICRLATPVFAALAFLARLFDPTGKVNRGRWPDPSQPCAKHAVNAISAIFGALSPLPVAIFVWLAVGGGFATGLWQWLRYIETNGLSDWTLAGTWFAVIVFALPLLLLFLIGLIANSFLLRPARRVLYGVMNTHVAAGGSRTWDGTRPNVVTLPIPSSVTILGFRAAIEHQAEIMRAAHEKTQDFLNP